MAELPVPGPHTPFRRWVIFPLGRLVAWLIMGLCGPYRVRGRGRVPKEGGVLILPNHRADVDPFLVQLACRRNLYFMGKSELFDMPVIGALMKSGGAFAVKRGEPDRAALKYAIGLLKAGQAVCIFPEGQLTETGDLQPIKPGVALIVRQAGCPVICLGLKGTDRIMPYGKFIPRPGFRVAEAKWGEIRRFEDKAPTEEILGWVESQLRQLTTGGDGC